MGIFRKAKEEKKDEKPKCTKCFNEERPLVWADALKIEHHFEFGIMKIRKPTWWCLDCLDKVRQRERQERKVELIEEITKRNVELEELGE